jgi:hypothetical protein
MSRWREMSEFEGKIREKRKRILARKWTWFSGRCGCGEFLEKIHTILFIRWDMLD